ncbi:HepT-like ribonuclease domain-containing protein [Pseudonocardia nantongensis]|uniref:HepT-like ribonuclease domain-containing protein n=1 Tax=Pseudonocardia nantongensis TaxID=1181885 RepID=UPI00397C1319
MISSELAGQLARSVGFRNVLVHDYVDVDDAVVLARLDDPSDLERFVTATAGWL